MRQTRWMPALALASLATACGGGGNNGGGGSGGSSGNDAALVVDSNPGPDGGAYQPLVVGATWTYDDLNKGVTDRKTAIIQAYEDVGGARAGVMAFRWQDTTSNGKQLTWYQSAGGVIGRVHDQSFQSDGTLKSEHWYDPYLLRVDETPAHLVVGATWTTTLNETTTSSTKNNLTTAVSYQFTVDSLNDPVTVTAGSFECLRLRRVDPSSGAEKTYWFAKGVGKVKEQSTDGTETLVSYSIPQ